MTKMGCLGWRSVCGLLLAVVSSPAIAQQASPPASVFGLPPQAAPVPAPRDPLPASGVTPLGTPLSVLKEELRKPAPKLVLARVESVATFRVTITPDYQAEFQRRLPSIFALSPEDKTAGRMYGRGAGFDPVVLLNAYKNLARSYEARQARKEVERVLEEFRRLAAIEREAAAKAEADKK